jgi:hypothetical protein
MDYTSLIRSANSFNRRLVADRTRRLPFIDNQTGVAQGNCALWRLERERICCQTDERPANANEGLIYSYPGRRWLNRRLEPAPMYDGQLKRTATISVECDTHFQPANELGFSSVHSRAASSPASSLRSTLIGELSNCFNGHATKTLPNDCRQHKPPPRADSTGSHSFADSDSRDQSSATSQSIESPVSQQLDDEQQHLCATDIEVKRPTQVDYGGEDNERDCGLSVAKDVTDRHGQTTAETLAGGCIRLQAASRIGIKDEYTDNVRRLSESYQGSKAGQVGEIKKSKLSKRKNVGSSLIKCNESLLLARNELDCII